MAIPLMGYVAAGSYVVPAAAGLIRFKALNTAMKVFAGLSVLTFLEIVAQYCVALMGHSNYYVINSYAAIECAGFLTVFILSSGTKVIRRILTFSIVLFLAFCVVDKIYVEDPSQINSLLAVIARILLIATSLVVLQSASRDLATRLFERAIFWVTTGVVLYSAGTLVVLGLSNRLLAMGVFYFTVAWYVNWILILIGNGFFVKAFLCRTQ